MPSTTIHRPPIYQTPTPTEPPLHSTTYPTTTGVTAGKGGLSVSYALSITQTLNWMVRMTSEVETNVVGAFCVAYICIYVYGCIYMCMAACLPVCPIYVCIWWIENRNRVDDRGPVYTHIYNREPTPPPTKKTPAVERLKEYSDVPSEAPPIIEGKRPPPHWPPHGRIRIVDLCLAYRPGLPLVLRNLTLDIKPGERVGIVGRCVLGVCFVCVGGGLFGVARVRKGSVHPPLILHPNMCCWCDMP